jgi:Dullard-like phosphatase family protein
VSGSIDITNGERPVIPKLGKKFFMLTHIPLILCFALVLSAPAREENEDQIAQADGTTPTPPETFRLDSTIYEKDNSVSEPDTPQRSLSELTQAKVDEYYTTYYNEAEKKRLELGLIFVKKIQRQRPDFTTKPLRNFRSTGKVTLVIDIDETLLHCSRNLHQKPDFNITTLGVHTLSCIYRPRYAEFLASVSQMYDIIIWSAGTRNYVKYIVENHLQHAIGYLPEYLTRDHCTYTTARPITDGIYVKELRILGLPLDRVIALDNSIPAYSYDLINLMPVISYYYGKKDNVLMGTVLPVLEKMQHSADVRGKLAEYIATGSVNSAL